MDTFRPFSAMHAAVIVAFAIFVTVLMVLGRRWRDTPCGAALDRMLAVLVFIPWILVNTWWLLPRNFDLQESLPLHVCDLVGLVVPIALLTRWRAARALHYYWGLGLSSQGFFTPVLRDGPARIGFWLFWINHFAVVGIAIYDLVAREYRPRWKDFLIGSLCGVGYVALMLPLDVWLGVNYGYVGPTKPTAPTLLDALGPWPARALIITGLGIAIMALMTVPWEIARFVAPPHVMPSQLRIEKS